MTNWKGFGVKRSWPNFNVLSRHSPGGTEKTTKNLSQDSWSLGRDLNPGPPEYGAGVLTTRPRRSVSPPFLENKLVYLQGTTVVVCPEADNFAVLFFHLCLGLVHFGFQDKSLYALSSPPRVLQFHLFVLLDLTILILFDDYEKLWSSSLYTFHLLLSTSTPSTLLGPGVPSTLSGWSDVLTAKMSMLVFWLVMPCALVGG
jgi:hypothetical protein